MALIVLSYVCMHKEVMYEKVDSVGGISTREFCVRS
jgi:hypothetical protein